MIPGYLSSINSSIAGMVHSGTTKKCVDGPASNIASFAKETFFKKEKGLPIESKWTLCLVPKTTNMIWMISFEFITWNLFKK